MGEKTGNEEERERRNEEREGRGMEKRVEKEMMTKGQRRKSRGRRR